jgi:putative tryptophan/tyrosine transport system substrate-binding protein
VGVKRREFITLLGGAAVWPLTARAQTSKPVVGFLNSASPDLQPDRMRAFLQGLSGAGYVEGQNVQIEYRWAKNQFDRLPVLADELVRRQVDVIVTGYNVAAAKAAKTATKNIPIVFTSGVDPVRAGLVASLNQPGGNITGVNILTNELVPKHVELLHELVSGAKDIGLLVNPTNVGSAEAMSKDAKTASDKIGVQLHVLHASKMEDFEKAFGDLRRLQTSTLIITPDSLYGSHNEMLATLALRQAVATISPFRDYAVAGGLMSYGGSVIDQGRQAGIYTARILNGEKPENLPVLQTTKVELTINLKTAKALGVKIPLPLLGRADEMIE